MEKLWLAHGYDTQQHQRACVPSNMDETVPVKWVSAAKADVGKLFLKNFFWGGDSLETDKLLLTPLSNTYF